MTTEILTNRARYGDVTLIKLKTEKRSQIIIIIIITEHLTIFLNCGCVDSAHIKIVCTMKIGKNETVRFT